MIVSEDVENEDSFPLPNARFIIAPYSSWKVRSPWLLQKALNRLRLLLGTVWRRIIIFQVKDADIMHAHFSFVGWKYLWIAQMTKIPMVISFYGFDYEYLPNTKPVWKKRYQKLFDKASLFLTEGNVGRATLIRMGCPEGKVRVVHLGVETANIPYHERAKRPNELRLVQIASFIEKKGQDATVKAFIKAFEKCPNMTLTFVGKDSNGRRGPLQQLISGAGLDDRVEFIDGIDFSELYSFLKNYQLFIHPSKYGRNRNSEGGAPVVLLDAQATGMPVLSTFHCDIPEEVVHGRTGLLVQENDVEGLAAMIETFYRMDQPEYHVYCEEARKHVKQNYESVRCAEELKKAYQRLLNQ